MPTSRTAVVGTGIIGAMTAWRLAVRGADVIAFDTHSPGHDRGASAGESRIFRTAYKEGSSYVPLLQRSQEIWHELERSTDTRLLTLCGGLTIGPPDDPDVAAVRRCAEERGLAHEVLGTDDARKRFPQHRLDDGEIMILDPAAGVLRPETAVQAALRAAEAAGARVLPYSPVDETAETPSGWRVSSNGEVFDVDHVIFAPGPWARQLDPLRNLPLQPRMLTACWFPARDVAAHEPGSLPVAIRRHTDAGFSCFPALDGVSIKIIPHHLARPDVDRPEDLPRSSDTEFAHAASMAAQRLLPGVTPHPIRIATYAEGFTPDEHALLGPLPGHDRATVMTGFSGHGFKLAPSLGEIAADLALSGTTPHDIAHLDPSRFEENTDD